MSATNTRRESTRFAALTLLNQGAVLIPYRAGQKKPLWKSFPGPGDTTRMEIRNAHELDHALHLEPWMNIAILGVAQVDADDQRSARLAASLGVNRSARMWMIRTRRGYRAIFKDPGDLKPVTKNGDPKADPLIELDLLANVPAVLPPSIHPSGFAYQWIAGNTPRDHKFETLDAPPSLLMDHWRNITAPRRAHAAPQLRQTDDFKAAVLAWARQFEPDEGMRIKPNGWTTEIRCPFPGHSGNEPRFAMNFESEAWKCWSQHGSGSLRTLAEDFGIQTVTRRSQPGGRVRVRGPV